MYYGLLFTHDSPFIFIQLKNTLTGPYGGRATAVPDELKTQLTAPLLYPYHFPSTSTSTSAAAFQPCRNDVVRIACTLFQHSTVIMY